MLSVMLSGGFLESHLKSFKWTDHSKLGDLLDVAYQVVDYDQCDTKSNNWWKSTHILLLSQYNSHFKVYYGFLFKEKKESKELAFSLSNVPFFCFCANNGNSICIITVFHKPYKLVSLWGHFFDKFSECWS